jgi:hypothetical protein
LVINLTLANQPITILSLRADDEITGSDHHVIQSGMKVDRQQEANNERVQQCNLAVITEDYMEAAEMLWMKLATNRAHLDA